MEERCSLARQQQEDLETALIKAQGEVLQLSREMQADRWGKTYTHGSRSKESWMGKSVMKNIEEINDTNCSYILH